MRNILIFLLFIFFFYPLGGSADENINSQIPKKIHYVWFLNNDEPESVKRSIATWKKHMPEYEIKRWSEKNCNMAANFFVKSVYEEKKWQYASDWCRLEALYNEGGIYLDTDMILTDSIEDLIKDEKLVFVLERSGFLSAGFIAVSKEHPFIKQVMEEYSKIREIDFDLLSPIMWTNVLKSLNLSKSEYKVLSPNVLMFDFGVPGNKGYHIYADGRMDFQTFGKWYHIFQRGYLQENGFCLENCLGAWDVYALPDKNNDFYIIRYRFPENKDDWGYYYTDKNALKGKYQIILDNEKTILSLQYENGKQETYHCKKRVCERK